jgi:hypothetical protein
VDFKVEELRSLPEALVGKTAQVLLILPLLPNLFKKSHLVVSLIYSQSVYILILNEANL